MYKWLYIFGINYLRVAYQVSFSWPSAGSWTMMISDRCLLNFWSANVTSLKSKFVPNDLLAIQPFTWLSDRHIRFIDTILPVLHFPAFMINLISKPYHGREKKKYTCFLVFFYTGRDVGEEVIRCVLALFITMAHCHERVRNVIKTTGGLQLSK